MNKKELIQTLNFYEKLSEQVTQQAYSTMLQSHAITLQLRATQKVIERNRKIVKKRWWHR